MKMKIFVMVFCMAMWGSVPFAQPQDVSVAGAQKSAPAKIILMITEQNIESPQRAWWASEIDLSAVEASIAEQLIAAGIDVLEPSMLSEVIEKRPAFRRVGISEKESIRLGNLGKADYVLVGKAVASAGSNVPYSSMRSCFAQVTAKLIQVKSGKVVAYLNSSGNSAHVDLIAGGREALVAAGQDLSLKIIEALRKEGGR